MSVKKIMAAMKILAISIEPNPVDWENKEAALERQMTMKCPYENRRAV